MTKIGMIGVDRVVLALIAVLALTGTANAQTATKDKGYAEVFAQSAFGNVTSQAYGGEIGFTVWEDTQIFVEGGQVRNVATKSISTAAQLIAGALTELQSTPVSYSVKQPVTFGAIGVRYPFVMASKVRPYVQAGFGIARVKNDVTFGVTGDISQFVTLGDDLSGTKNAGLFSLGVGAVVPVYQQMIVDLQFRYGRIFTEGEGINMSRAGIGLGVRF